jgi:ribonuclease J
MLTHAMRFKIHRGIKGIGVSCVEVWTDSTRIVIDLGMPFVNPDRTPFDMQEFEKRSTDELIREGILPDIPSLYQDGSNTKILIPHAYQDHYLFLTRINPSCHVRLGFSTQLLIELTNSFPGKKWTIKNAHHIKTKIDYYIDFGDIKITPYLMEQSAIAAYSFLIESKGKTLFFSGDFMMDGSKNSIMNFDLFCKFFNEDVDYLLLEGSAIGRTDNPFRTESELEEDFKKIFNESYGLYLVYTSRHNINRLITIKNACLKTEKVFLIDSFLANILKTLEKKTHLGIPFYSRQTYYDVAMYYPEYLTNRVIKSENGEKTVKPFKFTGKMYAYEDSIKVMILCPSFQTELERYLQKYDNNNGCFIYSMDEKYKNQSGATKDFLDFIAGEGIPIKDIHTSGYADLSSLKRIIKTVKPKNIVPIHDFEVDSYAELFEGTNVITINDKKEIII